MKNKIFKVKKTKYEDDYYSDLETLKSCPFDDLGKERVIKENNTSFIVLSNSPIVKNQLLVVPKRHLESLKNLKEEELIDCNALINDCLKALKKLGSKHQLVTLKEGSVGYGAKSIPHLHYNIYPGLITSFPLEDFKKILRKAKIDNKKREFYSTEKLNKFSEEMKKFFI